MKFKSKNKIVNCYSQSFGKNKFFWGEERGQSLTLVKSKSLQDKYKEESTSFEKQALGIAD